MDTPWRIGIYLCGQAEELNCGQAEELNVTGPWPVP